MKKFIIFALTVVLALFLAACGGGNNNGGDPKNTNNGGNPAVSGNDTSIPPDPGFGTSSFQYVNNGTTYTDEMQIAFSLSDRPSTVTLISGTVHEGTEQNCSLSIGGEEDSKNVTLDLSGTTFTVRQSDEHGGSGGLWFQYVNFKRINGKLNVYSLFESGVWCVGSDAEVDDIVSAWGAVVCEPDYMGTGSNLLVHGNVFTTGKNPGSATTAVDCKGAGCEVTIKGNVNSATAGVFVTDGGKVIIDGVMTVAEGSPYVKFKNGGEIITKNIDEYDSASQKSGYRQYSGGNPVSYVWVKE